MTSSFLKPYTLFVQTLTPVHVGTGVKLGRVDYLLRDGRIHVIDENKLIAWIASQPQSERLAASLSSTLLANGINEFIKNYYLTNDLKAITAYSLPFQGAPKDIFTFIKSPDHYPYLPGSSLKGALRSALLRGRMLEDEDLLQKGGELVMNGAAKSRPKTNSDAIQANVFVKDGLLASKWSNYDLNRVLLIRDSSLAAALSLEIVKVQMLSVQTNQRLDWKKKPNNDVMDLYVEALSAKQVVQHPVTWQANLFQAQTLGFQNMEALIAFFPEYCRRASQDLLTQEFEFYKRHGHSQLAGWFETYLNRMSHSPGAIILPLGWGGGYDAKTITDLLGKDVFSEVVETFDNTSGLGKPGRNRGARWLGPGDAPKSRKVVVTSDGNCIPMGWFVARFQPVGAENWLDERREFLSDQMPQLLSPERPVLTSQPAQAAKPAPETKTVPAPAPAAQMPAVTAPPTPAAQKPAVTAPPAAPPAQKQAAVRPLIASFTAVPKVGDRFEGEVFETRASGDLLLTIPGLSEDTTAYAIIKIADNPDKRRYGDGARVKCEVLELSADKSQPGFWIVKCRKV